MGLVLAVLFIGASAHAQTHSQFFDYIGLNTYWNGANWASYAPGYSNMFTTDTATGNFILSTGGNAASAGLVRTMAPVVTVTPAGTVSATAFVGNGSGLTGVISTPSGNNKQLQYNNGGSLAGASVYYVSGTYNLGIGVENPKNKLDVAGNISLGSEGGYIGLGAYWDSTGWTWMNRDAGKFGIVMRGGAAADASGTSGNGGDIQFLTDNAAIAPVSSDTPVNLQTKFTIKRAGDIRAIYRMYIGALVITPTTTLEVAGTISATNIQTAGTFKVGSYSSAPVTCSASYKGMFAMNSTDNLCLCNGTAWVGVGTGGTACAW
jgi:hypothetical protein